MRIIITENQELKLRLLRRLEDVDNSIPFKMREMMGLYNICKQNPEIFIDSVIGGICYDFYCTYFSHIEDDTKEWKMVHNLLEKYIRAKFTDRMIKFHSQNCPKK